MFQFRVHFCEMLVPRGVSRAPLAVVGRTLGDLRRPVSICDGLLVTRMGLLLGSLWLQMSASASFEVTLGDFLVFFKSCFNFGCIFVKFWCLGSVEGTLGCRWAYLGGLEASSADW